MAYGDHLVDKRVVDRNIRKGLVDPKQLDKHLRELPDVAENVDTVSIDDDADDDNED